MSAPEPVEVIAARVAALQREIEQTHAELHDLAEQVADLRRVWNAWPGWLRWFARTPPRGP